MRAFGIIRRMRITSLTIRNFRSFGPQGATITFPSPVCVLVGRNNSGKSNVLRSLEILLGPKSVSYAKFGEDDFNDPTKPIEISVTLGNITATDKTGLFAIGLTKQQMGAFSAKLSSGEVEVEIRLRRNPAGGVPDEDQETAGDTFEISLWGFNVFKKKDEVRLKLTRLLMVPSMRSAEDELSASQWTVYGQLMKETLEGAPEYAAIKKDLRALNKKIQTSFGGLKRRLLAGARVASYVDDIEFQLTKDNNPSELLRNLQVFIKDNARWLNVDRVGTGTQSAIIIAILELALKAKTATHRFFCIEEPEAFIHPHGVRYLGDLIRSIPGATKTQVLISTHSLSLLCSFEPSQIIRLERSNGTTAVRQSTALSAEHLRRFIHQDNAELFFSDRVVFVEGATEKVLFSTLDKHTKLDPNDPQSPSCNLDRANVGVIRLDSKDSIHNYTKIANDFRIPYCAILDYDFIGAPKCQTLCEEVGVAYEPTNPAQLLADLRAKNIIVVSKGEIEDLIPDADVATISGHTLTAVQAAKAKHKLKTSKAFRQLFGMGKHEYAIKIAAHYVASGIESPIAEMLRRIYRNEAAKITM